MTCGGRSRAPATGMTCSPLHPLLRGEVARYGELVGACYAALEDPSSPRYMNCKYGKLRMLEDAGAGYEVTRYIYSSPDAAVPGMEVSTSGRASWAGYVAVSTDETTRRLGRCDVLVSFRGTVTPAEWMANHRSSLVLARLAPRRGDGGGGYVKVESGLLNIYTSADETCRFGCTDSCRNQLLREVSRLVASRSGGEDVSVTLANHSMGGALALLLAYDLAVASVSAATPPPPGHRLLLRRAEDGQRGVQGAVQRARREGPPHGKGEGGGCGGGGERVFCGGGGDGGVGRVVDRGGIVGQLDGRTRRWRRRGILVSSSRFAEKIISKIVKMEKMAKWL
ncbi:Os02g0633000 [Oryza sativa Japonica Group]|uniref:Os02g0633000 protein n=2 Tax=Oryza sativa subsp. japonica TaxID=39947 RepID=A0A0P0VM05_ORYSJ|nr:Os02g0633000 [Oryza sativa Japonica Group]